MKTNCPHCQKEIRGSLSAYLPKEQVIKLRLTTKEGVGLFTAKSVGETMASAAKFFNLLGKDLGSTAISYLSGFTMGEKTDDAQGFVEMEFCIVYAKPTQEAPCA